MEIVKALPYPFLRNCAELLYHYNGEQPFHLYLKQEFKKNSSWGSRDRRNYRQFCYQFWRRAEHSDKTNIDAIITWLRNANETEKTHVNNLVDSDLEFPKFPELSKFLTYNSNHEPFSLSKWVQGEPPVWIKVVNIHQFTLIRKRLEQLVIPVVHEDPINGALAISSQSNINALEQEGLVIIQDIGSQYSMIWDNFIESDTLSNSTGMGIVWDACCGAGGKSLSLRINYPKLDIQCSDIRQGVLENCVERFNKSGLAVPFVFKHNLANSENKKTKFKIVLADIPCSGSGTWRRNPEERWFYNSKHWDAMVTTQLSMISNAAASVMEGGYLVICTCSLFARENEGLIEQFMQSVNSSNIQNDPELEDLKPMNLNLFSVNGWEIIEQGFCGGIEKDGDYIFRSILKKV